MATKSYSFYSKDLNPSKLDLFVRKGEAVREYKNKLSAEVSSNLLHYMDLSKIDFIKLFGMQTSPLEPSDLLRGNEIQKAAVDVFDAYQNKLKQIKQKIKFTIQKELEVEYYKKNTKKHRKGDIRSVEISTKSTPLSKSLSFLSRYGSESTPTYIDTRLISEKDKNKRMFYVVLKEHITKFGFERLLRLALVKRSRLIKKYGHPITFESLSYRSAIQSRAPLIQNSENKNFCNAFVSLPSFFKGMDLFVPTSFNFKHQGHLNQYVSKEYIVCIEQRRNRIRIITTKEVGDIVSPEGNNCLGVDTNVKHCLFSTSDEQEIDFDRELFSGYISFLKKHQEKKEHSEGEEKQFELWQERIQCMIKKKARELVDYAITQGKDHIVMEDLSSFGRSFVKSEEFEGFKYSRLCRLLNLSSLNKIVKGICKKLGVRLTLVPASYTSQWCFHCGFTDRSNRPNQETFCCSCCGHTTNADFHSSIAILLLYSVDVLRNALLMRDKSSDWIPKKLSRKFIKKQLEDIIPELVLQPTYQKLVL